MSNTEGVETTCDWCLQEARVQTIDEKLWRFWKIISTEDPNMSSHKNICDKCKSRYEGFSIYIESCKINASKVDELLSTRHVKDEPSIDIQYPPLIKKEVSDEVDWNSYHPAVSSGVFIEGQMLAGCSNSPMKSNDSAIDNVLSAEKVKMEPFVDIEDQLVNEEGVWKKEEASNLDDLHTHTSDKPYKCSHCNKSFTRIDSLNVHLRVHTGEKLFKCSHCSKSFTRLNSLNVHLRIHTGEKPYKCLHCNKRFTQSSHLNVHLSTHTGEKLYKCSHCSKSFTTLGNLNVHLRTHSGKRTFQMFTLQ